MNCPISVDQICTVLQTVSANLHPSDREQVQTLVASTSSASRALCLFPIRMHAPVEVWANCIYSPNPDRPSASSPMCSEAPQTVSSQSRDPVGWVCALRPRTFDSWLGSLADLVDAFHFFAPLNCLGDLGRLNAPLASQVMALQRIRPCIAAELYGEEITFSPPAKFWAPDPGAILLRAVPPLDPFPVEWAQHGFDPLGECHATVVVLFGTATKIAADGKYSGELRPISASDCQV